MSDAPLVPFAAGNDADLALVSSSGKFLPQLRLMTANSEPVKSGQFPVNQWALVQGSNFTDLGKTVNAIVLAVRPKAMRIGDTVEVLYDPHDSEFKAIQAEADENPQGGCMYGPDFLVWLPDSQKYADLFLVSKSARRQGNPLRERAGRGVTLVPDYIKTKNHSWWSFKVESCDSITPDQVPPQEEIQSEVDRFMNPPKQERAEAGTSRER